jgi:hypothetical protein
MMHRIIQGLRYDTGTSAVITQMSRVYEDKQGRKHEVDEQLYKNRFGAHFLISIDTVLGADRSLINFCPIDRKTAQHLQQHEEAAK